MEEENKNIEAGETATEPVAETPVSQAPVAEAPVEPKQEEKNGSNKTRLEVPATVENNGWKFKVVITAFRDGATVESNACTLTTGETAEAPRPVTASDFSVSPTELTLYVNVSEEDGAALNVRKGFSTRR